MSHPILERFLAIIESIRLRAFIRHVPDDKWDAETEHADLTLITMCRYLQEIELFLTVRHGVKHGDVGIRRPCVGPLIVTFFGTHQTSYAYEMLYYWWLLKDNFRTLELQRAILASGIVDWLGRRTTFKPIDLSLKHFNGANNVKMKCYKNSTYDIDIIFNRVYTSTTSIHAIRSILKIQSGGNMPGTHTTVDISNDIFNRAYRIWFDGPIVPRRGPLPTGPFESENNFTRGTNLMVAKVSHFNTVYTSQNTVSRKD